ncbi:MAG: hypothetical protein L6Q57_06905 [Alphaproteobacteria bacterium]|nr:hypothetical protein [Alphaproteobacteria bacterium]
MTFFYRRRKVPLSAYIFAAMMFTSLLVFIAAAVISSGPIVLGTEMNGDGSLEYLCLGRGCEIYAYLGS